MLKTPDSEVGDMSTDSTRRHSIDKVGALCSFDNTREITAYTNGDDQHDEQPEAQQNQISKVLVKL
jgi:hypothetical protein